MATYAVHDGTTVLNVLIADSVEDAERATGLSAVETDPRGPGIGWTREGSDWRSPQGLLLSEMPDPRIPPNTDPTQPLENPGDVESSS